MVWIVEFDTTVDTLDQNFSGHRDRRDEKFSDSVELKFINLSSTE